MPYGWTNQEKIKLCDLAETDLKWHQIAKKFDGRTRESVRCKYYNLIESGFVKKDLSVRVHECPYCGLVLDRDIKVLLFYKLNDSKKKARCGLSWSK